MRALRYSRCIIVSDPIFVSSACLLIIQSASGLWGSGWDMMETYVKCTTIATDCQDDVVPEGHPYDILHQNANSRTSKTSYRRPSMLWRPCDLVAKNLFEIFQKVLDVRQIMGYASSCAHMMPCVMARASVLSRDE
jgi:hypothetical protein